MAKDKKKFKVVDQTEEDIKRVQEENATDSGGIVDPMVKAGIPIWKPKNADNRIRILPIVLPDDEKVPKPTHFGFSLHVHTSAYNELPRYQYLSLQAHKGKKDPIFEEYQKIVSKNGYKDETAKKLKPKERIAYYVVDRDDEAKGVQLWMAQAPKYGPSVNFDAHIMDLSYDDERNRINFVSPDKGDYKGRDVKFKMAKSEGSPPAFTNLKLADKSTPLHADEATSDAWLEWVAKHPLSECFVYYDYSRIKAIFTGETDGEDEPDESVEEKPAKKEKAAKPAPAAKAESADSEDSEDSASEEASADSADSVESEDAGSASKEASESEEADSGDSESASEESSEDEAPKTDDESEEESEEESASEEASSDEDSASEEAADSDDGSSDDEGSEDEPAEKPAKDKKQTSRARATPVIEPKRRGRPPGSKTAKPNGH